MSIFFNFPVHSVVKDKNHMQNQDKNYSETHDYHLFIN